MSECVCISVQNWWVGYRGSLFMVPLFSAYVLKGQVHEHNQICKSLKTFADKQHK